MGNGGEGEMMNKYMITVIADEDIVAELASYPDDRCSWITEPVEVKPYKKIDCATNWIKIKCPDDLPDLRRIKMSDFKIVNKRQRVDPRYGLEELCITKAEIEALLSGKKLYSTVNDGECVVLPPPNAMAEVQEDGSIKIKLIKSKTNREVFNETFGHITFKINKYVKHLEDQIIILPEGGKDIKFVDWLDQPYTHKEESDD